MATKEGNIGRAGIIVQHKGSLKGFPGWTTNIMNSWGIPAPGNVGKMLERAGSSSGYLGDIKAMAEIGSSEIIHTFGKMPGRIENTDYYRFRHTINGGTNVFYWQAIGDSIRRKSAKFSRYGKKYGTIAITSAVVTGVSGRVKTYNLNSTIVPHIYYGNAISQGGGSLTHSENIMYVDLTFKIYHGLGKFHGSSSTLNGDYVMSHSAIGVGANFNIYTVPGGYSNDIRTRYVTYDMSGSGKYIGIPLTESPLSVSVS